MTDEYWRDLENAKRQRNHVKEQRRIQAAKLSRYRSTKEFRRQAEDIRRKQQQKEDWKASDRKDHRIGCGDGLERRNQTDATKCEDNRWKETEQKGAETMYTYETIPWPPDLQNVLANVSAALSSTEATGETKSPEVAIANFKTVFRRESLKWHPDKFFSRFRHKIDTRDLERVTKQVHSISQSILEEYSSLKHHKT